MSRGKDRMNDCQGKKREVRKKLDYISVKVIGVSKMSKEQENGNEI